MLLMVFLFLCFCGQILMFFSIMRGQDKLYNAMREDSMRLNAALLQVEAMLHGQRQRTGRHGLDDTAPDDSEPIDTPEPVATPQWSDSPTAASPLLSAPAHSSVQPAAEVASLDKLSMDPQPDGNERQETLGLDLRMDGLIPPRR